MASSMMEIACLARVIQRRRRRSGIVLLRYLESVKVFRNIHRDRGCAIRMSGIFLGSCK